MKKTLTKLLVSLLIVLMLSNYCMSNIAYAKVTDGLPSAWGIVVEFVEDILGTVVGIFAIIPKVIVLPLCLSAQSFMASIAYSQGTSDADGNIKDASILNADTWFLTPFDIIFNKVALVDVNIFNIPNTPGAIKSIREAAAGWYYVMRNIAAAILLCVLIYVGIRMALSTVASDKAAYKKMLVDWVASLALIFLLQYIIVFTFAINTAFIKSLESISKSNGISTAILKLYASALWIDMDSVASTIVICMLTWQTISLLISYISRMLKVTFLVIISPLITLTYSIDKMGDGKAQALNTWLKEFIYTVLLQPFHCIIYTAFIGIAMAILAGDNGLVPVFEFDNNNIGAAVLCILCIHFIKEAEKILGKIFNFADSTSGASLATGMMATAAIASNAKNLGKGARSVVNGAKNMGHIARTAKIEGLALGAYLGSKNKNSENPMTYEQAREQVTQDVEAKKQAKINQKAEKMYEKHKAKYTEEDKKKIENLTKTIQEKNPKMSEADARRQAQIQTSREKMENGEYKSKAIKKARGFVSAINNTETAKELKNVLPQIVAAGTGIFVGAGSFGVGGNAVQSIMLGSATSKGTTEFFKTSSNRLANENAKLIQGSGARTREEAMEYLGQIAGREDEFRDASKQLETIYSEILAACGDLNGKQKNQVKGSLRNIIDSTLMHNPGATDDNIMDAIKNNKSLQFLNIPENKDLQEGISEAIDFQRGAKIFENMSNVTSWGLRPEVMMDDTIARFEETSYDETAQSNGNNRNTEGEQQKNNSAPDTNIQTDSETDSNAGGGNDGENGEIQQITFEDLDGDQQKRFIETFESAYNRESNLGNTQKAAEYALQEAIDALQTENKKLQIERDALLKKLQNEENVTQDALKRILRSK